MKNPAILLFALLFFPVTLSSQRQCVHFNEEYRSSDTIYSLSFNFEQMDAVRAAVLQRFGTPSSDSYGNMIWKGVSLPNIGEQLEIRYSDFLCTNTEKGLKCKSFKSEKDKNRRISSLMQNQSRMIQLEILDVDGREILRSMHVAREAAKLFGGTCN
jgi:hypothetical protein